MALRVGLAVAALIFRLGWVDRPRRRCVRADLHRRHPLGKRGAVIGCRLAANMRAVPSLVIRIGGALETDLETRGLEISESMTRESVHGLPGRYRDGRVVDLTTGEPYPAMPGARRFAPRVTL